MAIQSAFVFAAFVGIVNGHGAIVTPRSRNSIDYLVNVDEQSCSNVTGDPCHNGQASFWYSQGCFIGCPTCDHKSGRRQTDLCGLGKKATINDPKYRSVNRHAEAGSIYDIYKHNPWRAPGSAPVGNACGFAGGTPWGANVGEAGEYIKTIYAHHGMHGTDLPKMPTGTVWKRGSTAEVAWSIRNNHGGGYQYRLCPANETLTEACFQANPLEFVQDEQAVVFPNGTELKVTGTFINQGTMPAGSTWAMMPMPPTWLGPRCIPGPNDTATTPNRCLPHEDNNMNGTCVPCPQTPGSDCSRCDNGPNTAFPSPCEGCNGVSWGGKAVKDMLVVPSTLPAGEYVLGFRYDCEATAQVWSNCADVTLE